MNKKLIVAVAVAGLTSYLAEPYLNAVDNPHTHTETPEPSILDVTSPITVSGGQVVEVLYSTPAFVHKNHGQPGQFVGPKRFASVAEAMKAPLPNNCDFAMIHGGNGYHVYSRIFGWEFIADPAG